MLLYFWTFSFCTLQLVYMKWQTDLYPDSWRDLGWLWGEKTSRDIHLLLDILLVFLLADWNIFGMPLCLLSVFPQLYFHMIRQRKKVLGHAEDYSKVEWPDHTEMSDGGKKNLKQPKEEEHKHKRSSGPELAWLETVSLLFPQLLSWWRLIFPLSIY